MRRQAAVIGVFLLFCTAACTLRRQAVPLSPYCRGGSPLAGVYHPARLQVKDRCRIAIGTVSKVVFETYDGDVHVDLRVDAAYENLLADGNSRVGGNLVVEVIPFDRSRVAVPEEGTRVEVVGPWVEDDQHGWNEIHPAWWVSAGRIQPASTAELRAAQLLLQRDAVDSK
ncbi:MAG TPA: hypothetical protein VH297_11945 [Gaiellaceae bacterium]